MFPNSNCYLFSITRKMVEMKSQLQIDFYKMREGKLPFDNAEENQPKRVAEIFTMREFMKLNSSRFRSNLAYFSENDCFSHFIQRPISSNWRQNFKNWKSFFIITSLSTITSLIFYLGDPDWEQQSHLQRDNVQISKSLF